MTICPVLMRSRCGKMGTLLTQDIGFASRIGLGESMPTFGDCDKLSLWCTVFQFGIANLTLQNIMHARGGSMATKANI